MNAVVIQACPGAEAAARLAGERIAEITGTREIRLRFQRAEREGFALTLCDGEATVAAVQPREFIAGVGRLLDRLRDGTDGAWEETPRFPIRIHYMPAHFGNPFEVMWPGEMQRYLEDLALWGSSGYGDWFDPNDMPDPYHPHVYCSSSMTLWQRKKDFLRRAKALGLDTMLWVAHNVGFVDQMRPEWVGVRSLEHRVQGQVLCPSIPEARAVCLRNHENLFADLAASGVQVDKLCYGPYDDGGCACPRCQPYYATFLRMVLEIHEIAQRYFPDVKADLCGWWVTPEEMALLESFAAGPAKAWLHSFQYSVNYEALATPDVSPPGGLPLSLFFHIGYSHRKGDVYLTSGIHSAPLRIRAVLDSFAGQGGRGFHTYNESYGDHYNQFLATRLARVPGADLRELTRAYCRQMYALTGAELERMTDVLLQMEMLESEQAAGWAAALRDLRPNVSTPPRQAWAFEHMALKAELLALDHRIGTGEDWRSADDLAPVLPLIERRLELSERLWRDVYGLGILRHIFIPAFMMPPWHRRYAEFFPTPEGHITLNHFRVSRQA